MIKEQQHLAKSELAPAQPGLAEQSAVTLKNGKRALPAVVVWSDGRTTSVRAQISFGRGPALSRIVWFTRRRNGRWLLRAHMPDWPTCWELIP